MAYKWDLRNKKSGQKEKLIEELLTNDQYKEGDLILLEAYEGLKRLSVAQLEAIATIVKRRERC